MRVTGQVGVALAGFACTVDAAVARAHLDGAAKRMRHAAEHFVGIMRARAPCLLVCKAAVALRKEHIVRGNIGARLRRFGLR